MTSNNTRGFFRGPRAKRETESEFAWCESWTAGPTTPIHIRRLTPAGLKPSGGADTAALCGREVAWDVSATNREDVDRAQRNEHPTARFCASCATTLRGSDQ